MGVSFSCPFATFNNLDIGLESIILRSVCLRDDELKTLKCSNSFKGQDDSESISYEQKETQALTLTSVNAPPSMDAPPQSPSDDLASPKHKAAVKLQKVYKSFRTRRKLADCAVLVEQSWWKLLDFAELKHSSISFFDIDHHETAISRWSRAKTRAAKVGKGLSKNGKAKKLALQHWLEAIDPRHRYGHNLHFYYVKWLESQSREPFFYWLDIGEGKEVNLVEKCPRCKLQQQCIKYLGPMERRAYEVTIKDGKLFYKESGEILDTSADPHAKWIFVLSASKTLYVGKKKKGTFQHSSFLAGGATSAAGRLVVQNGILKAVWPHSGHYKPTQENFQEFISFLQENNVDLTDVKMDSVDDDEKSVGKQRSSFHFRNNSSEDDLIPEDTVENDAGNNEYNPQEKPDLEKETAVLQNHTSFSHSLQLNTNLTHLQIPKRDDLFARMQSECLASDPNLENPHMLASEEANSSDDDDQIQKAVMVDAAHDDHDEEIIPAEAILQRINSHKETKSYQLAKQLSCRWTTGAGPRIGCVRDYPSELQVQALEQVNLSPRSAGGQIKCLFSSGSGSISSPNALIPTPIMSCRSSRQRRVQASPLSKGRKLTP